MGLIIILIGVLIRLLNSFMFMRKIIVFKEFFVEMGALNWLIGGFLSQNLKLFDYVVKGDLL